MRGWLVLAACLMAAPLGAAAHSTTTVVRENGVPTGTSYRSDGAVTEQLRNGVPTGETWVKTGQGYEQRRNGVPTGATVRRQ